MSIRARCDPTWFKSAAGTYRSTVRSTVGAWVCVMWRGCGWKPADPQTERHIRPHCPQARTTWVLYLCCTKVWFSGLWPVVGGGWRAGFSREVGCRERHHLVQAWKRGTCACSREKGIGRGRWSNLFLLSASATILLGPLPATAKMGRPTVGCLGKMCAVNPPCAAPLAWAVSAAVGKVC